MKNIIPKRWEENAVRFAIMLFPLNLYSPRSWRVDKTALDLKRSSPVLFFCAVILRGLATGIGTGRAKQIY